MTQAHDATSSVTAAPRSLTVVAFGDSITAPSPDMPACQRWPALLEDGLRVCLAPLPVRVVNAGVGGNTSREGLARIEPDVLRHQPDMVLVQFGGNDATPDRDRHVHLVEYAANLAAIRAHLQPLAGCAMVLVTFPPVIDARHSWRETFAAVGGQDAFVEAYRCVTRDYARQHRLDLFDLDAVIRADPDSFVLPDGVHLSPAGNRAAAAALVPLVARWRRQVHGLPVADKGGPEQE